MRSLDTVNRYLLPCLCGCQLNYTNPRHIPSTFYQAGSQPDTPAALTTSAATASLMVYVTLRTQMHLSISFYARYWEALLQCSTTTLANAPRQHTGEFQNFFKQQSVIYKTFCTSSKSVSSTNIIRRSPDDDWPIPIFRVSNTLMQSTAFFWLKRVGVDLFFVLSALLFQQGQSLKNCRNISKSADNSVEIYQTRYQFLVTIVAKHLTSLQRQARYRAHLTIQTCFISENPSGRWYWLNQLDFTPGATVDSIAWVLTVAEKDKASAFVVIFESGKPFSGAVIDTFVLSENITYLSWRWNLVGLIWLMIYIVWHRMKHPLK